jgi:hypothetical protein
MQLLKITTVPVKLKFNVEMAKLEVNQESSEFKQKTTNARIRMNREDIKLYIDSYPARKSMGLLKFKDFAKKAAQKGKEAAVQAMSQYAELGNKLAQAHKGVTVAQAAYESPIKVPSADAAYQPATGAILSWSGPQLETDYEPAHLEMNWTLAKAQLNYVPGKFEVEIEQYPDVQIEYLGSPSYVPPSADPNYSKDQK